MEKPQPKERRRPEIGKAEREALKIQIDGGRGRTFEGVQEQMEHFTILQAGRDYELMAYNDKVDTTLSLPDHALFINPSKGNVSRLISPPHWRAVNSPGFVGGLQLEDRYEPYFEANTKGVGYLKPTAMGKSLDDVYDTWMKKDEAAEHLYGYKMLGLADTESFFGKEGDNDLMKKTMYLISKGLRTEAYWGVAKLNNLVYRGELISVDEAREKGVITARKRFEPAIAVRLFKNNSRVEEAYRDPKRRRKLLVQAFDSYNQEERARHGDGAQGLTFGDSTDEKKFFRTFFERMGTNLAVLMNEGYQSLALHSSNITLAAEIADAETIMHHSQEKEAYIKEKHGGVRFGHLKDARDIAYSLRYVRMSAAEEGLRTSSRDELSHSFMSGFQSKKNDEAFLENDTDPEKANEWVQKIINGVIVEGLNLPPLAHHSVDEWPIKVG